MIQAREISIGGIVQGVGFRPFVYRLAKRLGLAGSVKNDQRGVVIYLEGEQKVIEHFMELLLREHPPLADIQTVKQRVVELSGRRDFLIEESLEQDEKFVLISPDIATCQECIKEIFSEKEARYRYPFTNCTNCGPRFTIVQDVPYDRKNTTMNTFKMCHRCKKQYLDPLDRRFHAQPICCPSCGPELKLFDNRGRPIRCDEPIKKAAELLKGGSILAIKGLGGYHLACNALDEGVLQRLRQRKYRIEKPFALMIKDIPSIKEFCKLTSREEEVLSSPRRPILLLEKNEPCRIAEGVAPKNRRLGVMLPYTPLHHLLLEECGIPLVMTSGNLSEEPIAYKDQEGFERLSRIADYFLIHNRKIHIRCDDSVEVLVDGREVLLRRSRGYVPYPILLPERFRVSILGCGAHLKNTFCITKGRYAFLSHHVGDLENYETFQSFTEGIEHFKRLFYTHIEIIAHDLHPEYLSTRYALSLKDVKKIGVQHHHAHIASCMIENGFTSSLIGISFDGVGYGLDGKIWGGEFMVCDLEGFERIAHLEYIPLVGGELAIRQPWRIGIVHLYKLFGEDFKSLDIRFVKETLEREKEMEIILRALKWQNNPLTSSMGRLFDAVSSILGIRYTVNYEAQAAIELEALSEDLSEGSYQFTILQDRIPWRIDPSGIIEGIVRDLQKGLSTGFIGGKFHNTIAGIILKIAEEIRKLYGMNDVALSGGVFQNLLLLRKVIHLLKGAEFRVLTHSKVPPNDGGISLGQVAIAHRYSGSDNPPSIIDGSFQADA